MMPLARYARDMGGPIVDVCGGPWISVRRACKALGIEYTTRTGALKIAELVEIDVVWANPPGEFPTFCISVATLPRWLLTIDPRMCRLIARPSLAAYQRACRRWACDYYGLNWGAVERALGADPWESADRINERDLWPAVERALRLGSGPVVDRLADIEAHLGLVRGASPGAAQVNPGGA